MGAPVEEVEKALVQMRSPRPETTRGTLNVTLAAHKLIMTERRGDEPIWQTMDRCWTNCCVCGPPWRPRGGGRAAGQADLPLLDRYTR